MLEKIDPLYDLQKSEWNLIHGVPLLYPIFVFSEIGMQ